MNYKKKSFILSIIIVLCVQIFLIINNKQKSSFRYFIWNFQEVSIGKLIFISFMSGLIVSSILNSTLNNDKTNLINEEDKIKNDKEYALNRDDENDSYEMPPERDLRDTQPTISVNYRVIKNNGENDLDDRKKTSTKTQSQDDWNINDPEW